MAVMQVEGNPSGTPSDNGRSVGGLCVTKSCVHDVNKRFGTHYKWPSDMLIDSKASDVFVKYTSRGRTFNERCRIWNKGWSGRNKRSAVKYAKSAMNVYEDLVREYAGTH